MKPVTFGSVCSGIEAASVAWHPLGWRAAWLSEIEPFPCAVLAHHYPTVPNLGDMTKLVGKIRSREVEAPDVFCGGTPCQAFSVAGNRQSLDDARGNLSLTFCEIANAIDDVRYAAGDDECVVFWENVPGVLSTKDNAFGCFLAGLAGEDEPVVPPGKKWENAGLVLGPRRAVAWRTLDAQYFGLAQRRRRVFVVASARAGFDPAAVLFEWQGLRRDTSPSREAGHGAAGRPSFGISPDCFDRDGEGAGGTAAERSGLGVDRELAYALRAKRAGGVAHHVEAFGGNNTSGPIDVATACNAHGGAKGRLDFESETFVAQPLPFDTTQITSAANRSSPKHGDPCHPLAAGMHPPTIAFSGKDYGNDATLELSPTLRAMNHAKSHANAGGQIAVAIGVDGYNGALTGDVAATMGTRGSSETATGPTLLQSMQVRRLTLRECERLQGFPDDYTLIPWRGRTADECPDGPRYKALGNSWAVPNVRWIGRRIDSHLRALSGAENEPTGAED